MLGFEKPLTLKAQLITGDTEGLQILAAFSAVHQGSGLGPLCSEPIKENNVRLGPAQFRLGSILCNVRIPT